MLYSFTAALGLDVCVCVIVCMADIIIMMSAVAIIVNAPFKTDWHWLIVMEANTTTPL